MSDNGEELLTNKERETLLQIVRKREKIAKSQAAERVATLLADFELQMDRTYEPNETDAWEKATSTASRAVAEAQKEVEAECVRLGIPKSFRPSLHFRWSGQGENGIKQRKTELRRIASVQLSAAEKKARTEIEKASLIAQERIMVTALTSTMARQFLEAIPSADALMSPLKFTDVRQLMIEERRQSRYPYGYLPDYDDPTASDDDALPN